MLPVDPRHHEETLAWLECSLGYVRSHGQTEAERLLETVRTEVELEAEYARISWFARRLLAQQAVEPRQANGRPHASLRCFGR